jgi:hypothetical protein
MMIPTNSMQPLLCIDCICQPLNIMLLLRMDGDACGVKMKPTKSAPSIEPIRSHTLLLLSFNGCLLVVVVWRWYPLIACSCYALITYAIEHDIEHEWRMLLAVFEMRPFNSAPSIEPIRSHTLLLLSFNGCLLVVVSWRWYLLKACSCYALIAAALCMILSFNGGCCLEY